jgi:hypothetical protein
LVESPPYAAVMPCGPVERDPLAPLAVICPTGAAAATLTPHTPNTTTAHAADTSNHHRRGCETVNATPIFNHHAASERYLHTTQGVGSSSASSRSGSSASCSSRR